MDLQTIYHIPENSNETTFSNDESLPALPLPKLEETLERYYLNLLPFGTEKELKNSKQIIENFKNGIGKKLHLMLEEKAKAEKNWVDDWWEQYAYMANRTPLIPYCSMSQPLVLGAVNVVETKENSIKNLSRHIRYNCELWELLIKERLKPGSSPDGKFSSNLWRRFFNTTRVPGEIFDNIVSHFKTVREGKCPSNMIIVANGRIFNVEAINPDGTLISYQQIYQLLHYVYTEVEIGSTPPAVPLLTCDDRTAWAKNRDHLLNLSDNNKNIIQAIEQCHSYIVLDDNEPANYGEVGLATLAGNYHSKWADKSSILVLFKNGLHGCTGEHSCYDGTLSISYDLFIQLNFIEKSEPNWEEQPLVTTSVTELKFDVDDYILGEIKRMEDVAATRQHDVIMEWNEFQNFGKNYLKTVKFHPDAFFQMCLQLTYYNLHKKFAPTYETAMMRFYYKGRTETVRSCSHAATEWVLSMHDANKSKEDRYKLLKKSIDTHNMLMKNARTGKGFDRHLFALWCLSYENGIETHDIYNDPLYSKSGGGGNFILSTSLLGYTVNTGFVAPMVPDGYGVFYSITENEIYTLISTFRDSPETSTYKFTKELHRVLREIRDLIDSVLPQQSKL